MVDLASTVFRDYETDGVASSGVHKPRKSKIREWGTSLEGFINAFMANGGLIYDTRANLFADLAHVANSSAWVISDATVAYNGIYRKAGGSGAGSWTRVADLPYSFIRLNDAGAGTANAIVATSSIPLPSSSSAALLVMNVFEANTGPVTISVNGVAAKTLKTNSGTDLAAGYLTAGMMAVFLDDGTNFRLLSDVASAAIQAAAEAAAAAAIVAQAAAEAAAAGAAGALPVATVVDLKSVDTTTKKAAVVYGDGGRNGLFGWNGANLSASMIVAAVVTTSVDASTETATKVSHGLRTGDAGVVTAAVNGLTVNTLYYVIWVTNDTFRLATSFANALAGTVVNLTGTTNFTFNHLLDPEQGKYVISTGTALDGSAGAWVRDGNVVRAAHFGASTNASATANAAALNAAARVSSVVVVDEALDATGAVQGGPIRNALFIGNGSLTGVFRKQVISDRVSRFVAPASDLVPARLEKFSTKAAPVVVLVGDSISTYNANTTGRQDSLAVRLERKLRQALKIGQSMTFYNRSIGGTTYNVFNTSVATTPIDANATWWTGGVTWKNQVKALNPDLVIFSFGSNDQAAAYLSNIKPLIDDVATWASKPNIIFCTNTSASLGSDFTYSTQVEQTGRDIAAGVTRSIAKYYGHGLLDFNRQFVAARDGYDPYETTIVNNELAAGTVGYQYLCPTSTTDFMVEFDTNWNNVIAAGNPIILRLGAQSLDWLMIGKSAGPVMRFQLSSGSGADVLIYSDTTAPDLGSGTFTLRVEVKGDVITVYNPSLGGPEGTNQPALFTSKIMRAGGAFTPTIWSGNNVLDDTCSNVSFWVASQRLVRPTLTDDQLFGRGDGEGSQYNHPGNYLGAHVYAPVLDAVSFGPAGILTGTYTPTLTGVANVASSVPVSCRYEKVSFDRVRVSGSFGVAATAGATPLQLGISLPLASDLAGAGSGADLSGVATSGSGLHGSILTDATNDRAQFQYTPTGTSNIVFTFTFDYIVK